jgi:hypothetical protein
MSLGVEGLAMAYHGGEVDLDPDAIITFLGRFRVSHARRCRADARKRPSATDRGAAEVLSKSPV